MYDTKTQICVYIYICTQTFIYIYTRIFARASRALDDFPIWAMEFGANYDFEDLAPAFQSVIELNNKKGKFGEIVMGNTKEQCLSYLPNYAITNKSNRFPAWKIQFIKRNREFYNQHKEWIDVWLPKIKKFENSHQKFEWNCGNEENPTIFNIIMLNGKNKNNILIL